MNTQIHQAARAIKKPDALLITAGAGEPSVPAGNVALPTGALAALSAIDALLSSR